MKKIFFTPLILLCFFAYSQNTAINMNGASTSYVNLGTVNPTGNFSTGFTIECWVKWNNFDASSRLVDLGNSAASDNILIRNTGTGSSSSLAFEIYQGGTSHGLTSAFTFVKGQWYHIAATQASDGRINLYVNGVLDAFTNIPLPQDVSRTLCYIGDDLLDGEMDEVRIWNVARTQAEIKRDMFKSVSDNATGLVAYYKCDEGSGTTLINSCTNGGAGNGTINGSVTWPASPIQFSGNALNFDGADDFAVIPNVVSSDFTVEYWMNTTATGGGGSGSQWYNGNGIVDAEVGGVTNDWGTALTGAYLGFGIGNPDITIHSTSAVNTGNWVHVAASWKQSTGDMKLYIDGTLEASGTGGTAARTAPSRITFGETQTDNDRFNGSIDEVRIWNNVRSASEISADMNNEIDPDTATNLIAYYTFNQGIPAGDNTGLITVIDQKENYNATLNNMALNGSSSNYVDQNNDIITLPLQWLSFTVQPQDGAALLRWSTASELNTKNFVIQRSSNTKAWDDIGITTAAGKSDAINNYKFLDAHPLNGINYYRIQQNDIDSRSSYSKIISLNMRISNKPFEVLNNPVKDGLLQLQVNKPAIFYIYTLNGSLLLAKQLSSGITNINMSSFPSGIYLLKAGGLVKKIVLP